MGRVPNPRITVARHLLPVAFTAWTLCLSVPVPAQDLNERMGLSEAVEFAVKHSGIMGAARAGTEVLEGKLKQAEWAAWPHIKIKSLLAPMPRQWSDPDDFTKGGTDLTQWGVFSHTEITGYIPLYTFGKISNLKAAARLGVDVGKAREDIARQEVVFRVTKAFHALTLSGELADVVSEGRSYLDKARRHLEELEESDDPEFDPVDMMKFRVYDAQVLARELEAERSAGLAGAALKVSMGLAPETDLAFRTGSVTPVAVPEGLQEKDLVDQALLSRAELVALKRGILVREAQVRAKEAAFYPNFLLAGQFKYSYTNMADGQANPFIYDPFNGYSAGGGLVFEWDLEIGGKLGELREAKAEFAKLREEAREAENGIRLEVAKLFREMRDQRRLVDAQKVAMEAARGWVIAKTDLYDNDLTPLNEVLDGLVQFFQTRMAYLEAVYRFNVAVAQLERATGATLPREAAPDE